MTDQVEDLEELRESFDLLDKNGNGSICAEELGILLRACGENPSKKEIENYTAKCNKNKDNRIEFEDFVRLMRETRGPKSRENHQGDRLRAAFSFFDKDNSGKIDIGELKRICTELGESLSEDELKEMFKLVDTNKDGQISIDEKSIGDDATGNADKGKISIGDATIGYDQKEERNTEFINFILKSASKEPMGHSKQNHHKKGKH